MGKKTKIALAIAAASAAVWAGTKAVVKPQKREGKNALQFERPVILGRHGAGELAPEHSMIGFEMAADYGLDGFKVDVRLTKDEEIVLFHDETLERTANFIGYIKDLTLDELKQFNIGEQFVNSNGETPYKEEQLEIVTLRELLNAFPNKLIYIDMKDHPDTYEGSLMPSKLWRLLEELNMYENVIVTSSYNEQLDRFNLYAQNRVAIGASDSELTKAFTTFTSQFGHLYNPKADVFAAPTKQSVMNFEAPKFVQFLTDLNCLVFYTGINEFITMQRLIRNGAKGIITDRPDIAEALLEELNQ